MAPLVGVAGSRSAVPTATVIATMVLAAAVVLWASNSRERAHTAGAGADAR